MMLKILPYVKKYKKYAISSQIMMILEVIADIAIPYMMSLLVDNGIRQANTQYMIKMVIYMILVAIFGMVMGSVSSHLGATAGYSTAYEVRDAAFKKVQDFSFKNLDSFSIPSLITRITQDSDIVGMVTMMSTRMAIRAPFMMIFGLFMAFRINKDLSLVYFIAIPMVAVIIYFIMKKAYPLFMALQSKIDGLNSVVQENLVGIRVVKSFNRQDFEVKKFKEKNDETLNTAVKAISTVMYMMPSLTLTVMIALIVILYKGANLIWIGKFSQGQLITFITYNTQILMALMMMSMYFMQLTRANASAGRLLEVINTESEIKNEENAIKEVKDGSIEFRNVNFSYFNNEDYVLKNINLKIKSGETIGIIGSTGSSKTTLVSLIPRLYDVRNGEVLVSNVNVKKYDIKSLRNKVAMVLQKNTLISGTIKSNLLWGDENASDEKIIEALKSAKAWEFVGKYKDTINHVVDQGGANFSGGQRQRLTIARALMTNPKILILDDSTSALDMATDKELRKTLNELHNDVTKLIIAQRIDSIKNCDRILVLEHGMIESIGTHEELLKISKVYREINESQEGGIGE